MSKDNDSDYCLYFDAKVNSYKKSISGDYIEYIISVSLVEKPDEKWVIIKRYSDFVKFSEDLKNILKV